MADNPLAGWLDDGGRDDRHNGRREHDAGEHHRYDDHRRDDEAESGLDEAPASAPGEGPDDARRPRWRRLMALATVPWALVLLGTGASRCGVGVSGNAPVEQASSAVGARTNPTDVDSPSTAAPSRSEPNDSSVTAPASDVAVTESPALTRSASSGPSSDGSSPAAPEPHADATATDVIRSPAGARAALAVRNRIMAAGGVTRSYVDFVMPERIQRLGDMSVVTVLAVVLEGDDTRWHSSRTVRYAVPLVSGPRGPMVAGPPWPLPTPPAAATEGGWTPADVDMQAVRTALDQAGFADVRGLDVHRRAAVRGIVRATFRGRAVTEPSARRHRVWLTTTPHVRVLGFDP